MMILTTTTRTVMPLVSEAMVPLLQSAPLRDDKAAPRRSLPMPRRKVTKILKRAKPVVNHHRIVKKRRRQARKRVRLPGSENLHQRKSSSCRMILRKHRRAKRRYLTKHPILTLRRRNQRRSLQRNLLRNVLPQRQKLPRKPSRHPRNLPPHQRLQKHLLAKRNLLEKAVLRNLSPHQRLQHPLAKRSLLQKAVRQKMQRQQQKLRLQRNQSNLEVEGREHYLALVFWKQFIQLERMMVMMILPIILMLQKKWTTNRVLVLLPKQQNHPRKRQKLRPTLQNRAGLRLLLPSLPLEVHFDHEGKSRLEANRSSLQPRG
mmetsp:Transcript_35355/g.85760  ORF Transcript_35355/g.85760 Transcript_35355/m.85760 type:complete len:317 (-) Transcript_35355:201-1151(-)